MFRWIQKKIKYGDLPSTPAQLLLSGSNKILDFYNKQPVILSDLDLISASIPGYLGTNDQAVSGTFIPIRPSGSIKVLVTMPENIFLSQSNKPTEFIAAYDEVQINTYNLSKKTQNISKLLKKYDKESKDFQGRLYNFSFEQAATNIVNFASLLTQLVINNNFSFSDDQSDLIMVGTNANYNPLYAQINQGDGFNDLSYGFNQLKSSKFVNGNTLFIYKNLDEINRLSLDIGAGAPSSVTTVDSVEWETFLNKYIRYPTGSVEHTTTPVHKQIEEETGDEEVKKDISKANKNPVKDASQLQRESRSMKSEIFRRDMEAKQKTARDWVGDNVIGNLDKTVDQLNKLEDYYNKILDKTGMTYIVRAALRCLELDQPPVDLADVKGFLLDVRAWTSEIIEILKIPVITLNDLLPTVDMMGDMLKQVFLAVLEAVGKALWKMLKSIIYTLLDNCDDPCAQTFGGVQMGAMLQKGGLKQLGKGLAGPALATAGSAALGGISTGLASENLKNNSTKFLSNLNKKVSPEQLKTLVAPAMPAITQTGTAIKSAYDKSPIGKFFEEASATLTCGESAKLFEGKSSPLSSKVIKSIAEKLCEENGGSTPDNPYCVLKDLVSDQDSINDFFWKCWKVN